MRRNLLSLLLLVFTNLILAAQSTPPIPATTNDGRPVLLKADGTWSFVREKSPGSATTPEFKKSAHATKKVDAPFGQFSLWFDPKTWTISKTEQGRIMLQSSDGKAYGLVVSEALPVPTSALKEAAMYNMRQKDPNVQVISEEKRVVNGREVLVMQMNATSMNMPFTFYGYYYGGSSGNVQVIAFTTQPQFAAIKDKLTEFLNGLVINDDQLPDAPASDAQRNVISVNDGNIRVVYDEKKWTVSPTRKEGKISLSNAKGNGWALIIPEKITVPLDSLPEIALNNAKQAAPDAHIVSREKKTVQGRDVWALRIAGTVNTLPFIYHGYYYSGQGGTVQVITFTVQSSFAEVEPEFTELLNGLRFDLPSTAAIPKTQ